MKKIFLFLGMSLTCASGLFAQAYIGQIEHQKTKEPAAATRMPYAASSVEDALKEYMMTKGYKSSGTDGFILFRSVPLDSADTVQNDLYFKAEHTSRKEKDMTVLSLLPAKKNADIRQGNPVDSARLEKARLFLDNMTPFITNYNVRLQVSGQQESLTKAQKKMNELKGDEADLQKKLRSLQTDLDQNQKDQVKAVADLQASVNADDDTKGKYQKRVNHLLDREGDLEKKVRRTKQDLEDNKSEQDKQSAEVEKQRQGLDSVKAKNR
jgi:hypothetical protein